MSKKFVYLNTDGFYEETAGAYEQSDFIDVSAGVGDAGKPIVLDANGHVDGSMVNDADIDHDNLLNTHNLTTDIDHNTILNNHNLTTDIDHNTITNTHNLTTDIDHGTINGLTDDDHAQYLLTNGGRTLTGNWVVDGSGTYTIQVAKVPSAANDVVNKAYADAVGAGFGPKRAVRVATTAELNATYNNGTAGVGATLTNAATQAALEIDGVTLAIGDRVLVKDQSTSDLQNGIYEVTDTGSGSTNWVLTRTTDSDNNPDGEIRKGDFTFSTEGTANSGYGWVQVDFTSGDVVGTDSINYTVFSAPQSYTGGDGIDITANVISTDLLASGGLKIVSGEIAVEPNDFAGAGLIDDGADNIAIDWSTAFNDAKAVKAEDLNSVANGEGASIIGLEDSAGNTSETNVEGAIAELYSLTGEAGGVEYTVGAGGVTKGDLVYISGNNTVSTYSNISNAEVVIGIAASTEIAAGTVKVLANDSVITAVLTTATAGTKYYWTGSGYTNNLASFTSGQHIWLGGVAKNATDAHVEVAFITKRT